MSLIQLIEHTKVSLRNPVLIQGLPGLGLVGKIAVQYLIDQLHPPLVARLVSDLIPLSDGSAGIKVKDHDLRPACYEFYVLRHEGAMRDALLVTSEAQPVSWGQYRVADEVMKYAERLGVNLVLALGGYVPSHPGIRGVFACTNDGEIMKELERCGVNRLKGGFVTGACGIMVGMAHVRGMKSACLLGTTSGPFPDPSASRGVLEVIDRILGIETDYEEMKAMIKREHKLMEKMKGLVREAMQPEVSKKEEGSWLPYHM